MKYRIIRRWRAPLRVILRLVVGEIARHHQIAACVDCLSGEGCSIAEKLLRDADILPEWKRD